MTISARIGASCGQGQPSAFVSMTLPGLWRWFPARTVYDALYLALAIRLKTHLITGDERLVNALAGIRELRPHVKCCRLEF
jgi:hypothetical protein